MPSRATDKLAFLPMSGDPRPSTTPARPRTNSPDLAAQLSVGRPVTAVVCCALDTDPAVPINAAVAVSSAAEVVAGLAAVVTARRRPAAGGRRRRPGRAGLGTTAGVGRPRRPTDAAPRRLPAGRPFTRPLLAATPTAGGRSVAHHRRGRPVRRPRRRRRGPRGRRPRSAWPSATTSPAAPTCWPSPPARLWARSCDSSASTPPPPSYGPATSSATRSPRPTTRSPPTASGPSTPPLARGRPTPIRASAADGASRPAPLASTPPAFSTPPQRADPALARRYGLAGCIECGICTYVCPTRLPLLASIRQLRAELP